MVNYMGGTIDNIDIRYVVYGGTMYDDVSIICVLATPPSRIRRFRSIAHSSCSENGQEGDAERVFPTWKSLKILRCRGLSDALRLAASRRHSGT